MSEREQMMENLLYDLLSEVEDVKRVDTFESSGVLTSNSGLVVKLEDGSEFQITIVRSK